MDTIIRFTKRFTFDLSHAIWFAALEYDTKLQETRTPLQRLFTWIVIAIIAVIIFFACAYGVWRMLDAIDVQKVPL